MDTPSLAVRQSSRERRSPATSSTSLAAPNCSKTWFKRPSWLDGRHKAPQISEAVFQKNLHDFRPNEAVGASD